MANWHYLKFRKWGYLSKRNINPPPNTFVWGFDMRDHKVKICFQDEDGNGYLMVVEPGRLNDDCNIVAWAPIEEGKSEPDLEEIKKCGDYWPPEGSAEYQRKLIRIHSRRKPKTEWERESNASIVAQARAALASMRKRRAQPVITTH